MCLAWAGASWTEAEMAHALELTAPKVILADAKRAEHTFRWILTDVVLRGDVEFLGFDPRVLPLFVGGFLEMLGLFGGACLELIGALGGGLPQVLGGFDCLFLQSGCLDLGGLHKFTGLFTSGGTKIVGGLGNRRGLGETGFRIEAVGGGKWIGHGFWLSVSDEPSWLIFWGD